MTLTMHWYLPTSGDGRTISDRAFPALDGTPAAGPQGAGSQGAGSQGAGSQGAGSQDAGPSAAAIWRAPGIGYLTQLAQAADRLGFDGMLTPTGVWCEDAWLVTAALARETERIKFIVAFRPGITSPTLAAHMAGTLQSLCRGRLLLNVVTGGHSDELRRFGDFMPHDERYARCDEFLAVVRGAWGERPFDFSGRYYMVEGATVFSRPDPLPVIYFGGSSPPAVEVAARRADVYLTFGEPPPLVEEKIAGVRAMAEKENRTLRFGMRVHVITRDRAADAWAQAARLIEHAGAAEFASTQRTLAVSESVGQRRQQDLLARFRRSGQPRDLEIYPGLWAGIGLLRGGAGTAMVGRHDQVADLIEDYASRGVQEFIVSGYPHLEEAYWFGEGVLPELRRRGRISPASGRISPASDPASGRISDVTDHSPRS